jgi:hypothetical protein
MVSETALTTSSQSGFGCAASGATLAPLGVCCSNDVQELEPPKKNTVDLTTGSSVYMLSYVEARNDPATRSIRPGRFRERFRDLMEPD